MKSLKILLLSSIFLFTNCSLINDKFFSKSNKNQEKYEEIEIAKESKDKPQEEELVLERVYIEDDKNEGLTGDTEYQNTNDYPNLAEVPARPDPAISLEDQEAIVKNIEKNSQLEPVPSENVTESKVSEIETSFNNSNFSVKKKKYNKNTSHVETSNSIRDIQTAKLQEIQNFKPNSTNNTDQYTTKEEEELHSLARELKNIKTPEEINKVEEKIKKNDLYYTPDDIEKILGLKVSNKLDKKNKEEVVVKKESIKKEEKRVETTIIQKQIKEREVPVARITFNHGSTQLTNQDISKINKVANLFYENEGKKIVIVGHASSRTNYNMDLTKHALVNFNISLERARKVMRQFSTIGLNSQKIELVAMSDAEPLYAEIMPKLEAANRRAEIFIQY
tara:strand:+ start:1119 stop:2294 length:1176 start_codon:yes stop_codon:yes gene_type:complete